MATNAVDNVFEFRGIEDLYYAEVAEDSETQFSTTTPKRLSYTAKIAKEVESSSETHYYDDKGMIVVNTKGAETFTLTVAPPKLEILADITGQAFDKASGMLIEGKIKPKYFAIGYKAKGTDGNWRFCWKYKGQFAIPSEENNTESDSVDTTNTELTYTAVSTTYKFEQYDGESTVKDTSSGIIVDERYGGMTDPMKEAWTKKVWTPMDVHNKVVPTGNDV